MAHTKWMPLRHGVVRIERAESLLLFPSLLPFGFDQVKRILSATAGHRAVEDTRKSAGLNLERGEGCVKGGEVLPAGFTLLASLVTNICSQLSGGIRFNTVVQDANQPKPHWLRVLAIGRRPRATLIRIAVLVVVCFVTFKFCLLPVRIQGISMEPTCRNGQVNFVNRLAYLRHEPQRGDIVSVRFAGTSIMYMKRIIALPGETLEFHAGRAYINGRLLDEPYLKTACDWEAGPFLCSATQYYIVGDNRSMPFILHEQGRAERERIMGKLLL